MSGIPTIRISAMHFLSADKARVRGQFFDMHESDPILIVDHHPNQQSATKVEVRTVFDGSAHELVDRLLSRKAFAYFNESEARALRLGCEERLADLTIGECGEIFEGERDALQAACRKLDDILARPR